MYVRVYQKQVAAQHYLFFIISLILKLLKFKLKGISEKRAIFVV